MKGVESFYLLHINQVWKPFPFNCVQSVCVHLTIEIESAKKRNETSRKIEGHGHVIVTGNLSRSFIKK